MDSETTRPAWLMKDGKPAPEFRLALSKPLPNGAQHLDLRAPKAKERKRALKLLSSAENPHPSEAMDMIEQLIADVVGLSTDDVGEMECADFDTATEYLSCFLAKTA